MINIKSDSRKIKQGDTFVAIKCEVNDGHKYIDKAIENGAAKIIAEYGNYGVETLIVSDTRKYLSDYLKENYSKYLNEMTIIGITGTNGKTTSAFLIYSALNKLGYKCAYIGTIGYYLEKKVCDLPNTNPDVCEMYDLIINAYDNGYRYIVLEASSHGLYNGRLEGIVFDYAIFTNLTQDHLDYHITMENYALAKQLLFKKLKPHGIGVVNIDDPYKDYFITEHTITYGRKPSDYQILDYNTSNQSTIIDLNIKGKSITINSPLLGDYNVYNLMCAIIILDSLKIELDTIKNVIKNLSCPPGRMDTVKWKTNSIVIDYAHTPDAVEHILKTIKKITEGHIYTVFGCTGDRDRTKRPIMMDIATNLSTKVIVTIDDPHNEDPNQIVDDMLKNIKRNNYEICLDRGKAIEKGIALLESKDVLMILGKGHEELIIYKDQKIPFNDTKKVLEVLKDKEKLEV